MLDQGYWPESTLTPPTDEAIQYDIRMTKEMGFNGARKHQKLEDPRFLYWADKMGFLVSGEMANAYLFDEQLRRPRSPREWMEAVERDYNHPSIIMWVPINESWGVPNLRDPRQQDAPAVALPLTKSLDAPGLVIDNEGWEHTEMTDLFAVHDYARSGDLLYEMYKILGEPDVRFPTAGASPLVPGVRYNGTPLYLSEFGGIAYIPPGRPCPPESWGYSGVEKTADAALPAAARPVRGHRARSRHHRHLLHADHRRRAGDQRPDDLRPQAEIRRQAPARAEQPPEVEGLTSLPPAGPPATGAARRRGSSSVPPLRHNAPGGIAAALPHPSR